jgi:zinc transport system ATP-binding protein
VRAAVDAVGLTDRIRDSVGTLSGGQQQRVLVARALAGAPELLVMDEPTAGIDLDSQQHLADVMTGLVGSGTTILLVAHEMGPLEPLIERTVVMRDGRVAYDGKPLASFQHADGHVHHHGGDPHLQRQDTFGVQARDQVGIALPFNRSLDEERP